MNKSAMAWMETRLWCMDHPGQKAAIMTPKGTFTLTFKAASDSKGVAQSIDYSTADWLRKCWETA